MLADDIFDAADVADGLPANTPECFAADRRPGLIKQYTREEINDYLVNTTTVNNSNQQETQ